MHENSFDMPEINAMNVTESRLSAETLAHRVSVVIVVWNAKTYVLECLKSLREHCAGVYSEVVVVDNASSDGTPDIVAERFPEFYLIRNSENLGFARANNIGMSRCTGDFICLVNSDVKFTSDCITPMLEYLAAHRDVAMLGPQMLSADGEVRRSTMRFPTVWNNFCRALGLDVLFKGSSLFGGMMMADFDHRRTMPVEVLNGWFILARRTAVERVGHFDPQFFMYGEDVDWSYRFHQSGEKLVFFAGPGNSLRRRQFGQRTPALPSGDLPRHLAILAQHHGWLAQQAFLFSLAGRFTTASAYSARHWAICFYLGSGRKRGSNCSEAWAACNGLVERSANNPVRCQTLSPTASKDIIVARF